MRQEDLSELIEQGTTSESDFSGLCNSQLHSVIMRALLARVSRCAGLALLNVTPTVYTNNKLYNN